MRQSSAQGGSWSSNLPCPPHAGVPRYGIQNRFSFRSPAVQIAGFPHRNGFPVCCRPRSPPLSADGGCYRRNAGFLWDFFYYTALPVVCKLIFAVRILCLDELVLPVESVECCSFGIRLPDPVPRLVIGIGNQAFPAGTFFFQVAICIINIFIGLPVTDCTGHPSQAVIVLGADVRILSFRICCFLIYRFSEHIAGPLQTSAVSVDVQEQITLFVLPKGLSIAHLVSPLAHSFCQ